MLCLHALCQEQDVLLFQVFCSTACLHVHHLVAIFCFEAVTPLSLEVLIDKHHSVVALDILHILSILEGGLC